RPLTARQVRRELPTLRQEALGGGAAYFDAQMDDARLCLEVIQTAVLHGAIVANYVEAVAFRQSGGTIVGAVARDRANGREFTIQCRQVLKATGPWVDPVCRLAREQTTTS